MLCIIKSKIKILFNTLVLIFFINIIKNNLKIISKNTKIITYPKKELKYDKLFKLYFIPAINLVPPQSGQGLPVIALYIQVVSLGDILFNIFAKYGKKTIYKQSTNIVILKYI